MLTIVRGVTGLTAARNLYRTTAIGDNAPQNLYHLRQAVENPEGPSRRTFSWSTRWLGPF